jgi:ribonuclease Z
VFLTSVGTQRASGLPGKCDYDRVQACQLSIVSSTGLLMTFADSGLTSLNIAGPAGLLHFMAAMRKYTFRY